MPIKQQNKYAVKAELYFQFFFFKYNTKLCLLLVSHYAVLNPEQFLFFIRFL